MGNRYTKLVRKLSATLLAMSILLIVSACGSSDAKTTEKAGNKSEATQAATKALPNKLVTELCELYYPANATVEKDAIGMSFIKDKEDRYQVVASASFDNYETTIANYDKKTSEDPNRVKDAKKIDGLDAMLFGRDDSTFGSSLDLIIKIKNDAALIVTAKGVKADATLANLKGIKEIQEIFDNITVLAK